MPEGPLRYKSLCPEAQQVVLNEYSKSMKHRDEANGLGGWIKGIPKSGLSYAAFFIKVKGQHEPNIGEDGNDHRKAARRLLHLNPSVS